MKKPQTQEGPDVSLIVGHQPISQSDLCGIRLLLAAYDCAQEMEEDVWQFAVELESLQRAGLTNTQLRRLLFRGYLEQGMEDSQPNQPRRRFQRVVNLSLAPGGCFVLTEAGVRYARGPEQDLLEAGRPGNGEARPVWDDARGELRLGQTVVKRFKQPAPNQQMILTAFEEEGWPPRIDDPLPPHANQDAKRRLHSTISNLNRTQEQRLIHFEGGGDAQSVRWRLLREAQRSEDRAKAAGV